MLAQSSFIVVAEYVTKKVRLIQLICSQRLCCKMYYYVDGPLKEHTFLLGSTTPMTNNRGICVHIVFSYDDADDDM